MPSVTIQDIPEDIYERLRQRAVGKQRSVGDELLALASQSLLRRDRTDPRLLELVPNEEIAAPCDLPRSSCPEVVPARPGLPRLPDPVGLERE